MTIARLRMCKNLQRKPFRVFSRRFLNTFTVVLRPILLSNPLAWFSVLTQLYVPMYINKIKNQARANFFTENRKDLLWGV